MACSHMTHVMWPRHDSIQKASAYITIYSPWKVPGEGERQWRGGLRIRWRNLSLHWHLSWYQKLTNNNNIKRCSGWFTKLAGGLDSKEQANNDANDHERNVSDHGRQVEPHWVLSILSCFLVVSSAVCFSCLYIMCLCVLYKAYFYGKSPFLHKARSLISLKQLLSDSYHMSTYAVIKLVFICTHSLTYSPTHPPTRLPTHLSIPPTYFHGQKQCRYKAGKGKHIEQDSTHNHHYHSQNEVISSPSLQSKTDLRGRSRLSHNHHILLW